MMQIRFTRLGRIRGDHDSLPEGASAKDMAVGQLLGLARSAGFRFDVIDGRLVTAGKTADWRQWPILRALLDDIGIDSVLAYFENHSNEKQRTYSSAA